MWCTRLLVLGYFLKSSVTWADDSTRISAEQPNIVFVLLDDVGFADLSYNSKDKMIPTPNIDKLANNGIKFDWHYSHPTCTPSRASLMSGKYSANVGLSFAMLPGSPVGLPTHYRTTPELLKEQGYSTHIVGKWHLGMASWAQLPVSRGFDTFIGSFSYDLTSFDKQNWREPWLPIAIDWMRANAARNYTHFAEPRHATIAITSESLDVLNNYGVGNEGDSSVAASQVPGPFFLYTAYTGAHAPLQPAPEHASICEALVAMDGRGTPRFPHLWRRQFCGMVVGLDEGVGNLTRAIEKGNGRDTVMVVVSDNGGSPWFGAINYPLRSGKLTAYEGGCRVPALAYDFSTDKRFFGEGGRTYGGLMHFSDWMPTFLGFAGVSSSQLQTLKSELALDGFDMGPSIRAGADSWRDGPRKSVLYEISLPGETLFGDMTQVGYRYENWKCVAGVTQDPHWYHESSSDMLNTTDDSLIAVMGEVVIRVLDGIFGNGPMDPARSAITHTVVDHRYMLPQFKELAEIKRRYFERIEADPSLRPTPPKVPKTGVPNVKSVSLAPHGGVEGCGINLAAVMSGAELYDLDKDPEERNNVAKDHPEVIELMTQHMMDICINRPQQQLYWMSIDLELDSLLPTLDYTGDCSMNPNIKKEYCRFQHPFLEDGFIMDELELFNVQQSLMHIIGREIGIRVAFGVVTLLVAFKLGKKLLS